jgi:hypothetical protein
MYLTLEDTAAQRYRAGAGPTASQPQGALPKRLFHKGKMSPPSKIYRDQGPVEFCRSQEVTLLKEDLFSLNMRHRCIF